MFTSNIFTLPTKKVATPTPIMIAQFSFKKSPDIRYDSPSIHDSIPLGLPYPPHFRIILHETSILDLGLCPFDLYTTKNSNIKYSSAKS